MDFVPAQQFSSQNIAAPPQPQQEMLFKSNSSAILFNKTQGAPQGFYQKSQTKPENPPQQNLQSLLKEKEPLRLTGKHFNLTQNSNKPELLQNIMKSPKNIPMMASKEETKKAEANGNLNYNVESMAQNLAKNKIIPSFLVQKKAGDKESNTMITTPTNTHLKINNFNLGPSNNKNSMLKTNVTPNSTNQLKGTNLFNFTKK